MRRRSIGSAAGVGVLLGLAGVAMHFGVMAWAGRHVDTALQTLGRQPLRTPQQRAADAAVDRHMAARQLTGEQRCVAGTVVVVDLEARSAIQLLGTDRRPIPCHGRYADAPLPKHR